MSQKTLYSSAIFASLLLLSTAAHSEDAYVITEKDKKFSPAEITIPAGKKVKITVKNDDATAAEFESIDLDREKIVGSNSEIIVYVGPLDAGKYGFFDDFHRETAKGTIIVK